MNGQLQSILAATSGLTVALLIALILTLSRQITAGSTELRSAIRVVIAAVVIQAAHFTEELATGFDRRFPTLLGLAPWPGGFFVAFNLFWLTLWALSAAGLRRRRRVALFAVWFLSIASIANGVGHPAFAAATRGYFPGLVTSVPAGIVGVVLFRRLLLLTAAHDSTSAHV